MMSDGVPSPTGGTREIAEPLSGYGGLGGTVTQGTSLVELGTNPGLWYVTALRYSLHYRLGSNT